MYLNTVFKYNVFKYCPALVIDNNSAYNFSDIIPAFDEFILPI